MEVRDAAGKARPDQRCSSIVVIKYCGFRGRAALPGWDPQVALFTMCCDVLRASHKNHKPR